MLLQYPRPTGMWGLQRIHHEGHAAGVYVVVATDLLALTCCAPLGSAGRMSRSAPVSGLVCRWDSGPHAAFMATKEEFRRQMPGRIIGVSKTSRVV